MVVLNIVAMLFVKKEMKVEIFALRSKYIPFGKNRLIFSPSEVINGVTLPFPITE